MMTYYVFAGEQYYPNGGLEDCVCMADTLQDALTCYAEHIDWGHIVTFTPQLQYHAVWAEEFTDYRESAEGVYVPAQWYTRETFHKLPVHLASNAVLEWANQLGIELRQPFYRYQLFCNLREPLKETEVLAMAGSLSALESGVQHWLADPRAPRIPDLNNWTNHASCLSHTGTASIRFLFDTDEQAQRAKEQLEALDYLYNFKIERRQLP